MTNEKAKKMLKAKLECLKRETSGTDIDCNYRNCDECNLCYEQGNMGEQKEALEMAIKALEQKPCEDCVSREEAIRVAEQGQIQGYEWQFREICNLPSVKPQRPKGKWMVNSCVSRNDVYHYTVHCDKCGKIWDYTTDKKDSKPSNYCPNCGAEMEGEE